MVTIAGLKTHELALAELAKFFRLAVHLDRPLKMWSKSIDAAWHFLLQDEARYRVFCEGACGAFVRHREGGSANPVRIDWVRDYERYFGPLPEIWFADEAGQINDEVLTRYRLTGEVRASWDCGPATCDGDPPPTRSRSKVLVN